MGRGPYSPVDIAAIKANLRQKLALKTYLKAILAANEAWLATEDNAAYHKAVDLAKANYRAELNDIQNERNGR